MPSSPGEFSDETLDELLRALHARTSSHPENPGLIAAWPRVPEARMSAACSLLVGRGHPVYRVLVPSPTPGVTRYGWSVRATTDTPYPQL